MRWLILNPDKSSQVVDDLDGHDLDGKTVLEVRGALHLINRRIDWETLTLVEDFSHLEEGLIVAIEAGAQEALAQVLPPERARIYARKEAEARAVIAGDEGAFPMLEAEATATGEALPKLAAAVIAQAEAVALAEVRIEAARRGAKVAVGKTRTIKGKREAANVDWKGIIDGV